MKTRTLFVAALMVALVVGLLNSADLVSATPSEKADFLIGFHEAIDARDQALVLSLGGEIYREFTIVNVVATRMTPRAAVALARNPRVSYVETDGPVYALGKAVRWGVDQVSRDKWHSFITRELRIGQFVPWGIDRVFGDESYSFDTWETTRGHGIAIAILDTGIYQNHEDLPTLLGGVNTIDRTHWGSDGSGHGTHVAGTVSALDDASGVVGVSPELGLYAVKVLSDGGRGTVSSVAAGIDWAVKQGIPVLNMSLGSPQHSQTLKNACDNAYAAGHLLVSSAGNDGNTSGTGNNVRYPARYGSVIAVAASDIDDNRAGWSSTGPGVELIAPGVSVLSTIPGDKYGTKSGTSMASPHVAGAAALAWSVNPGLTNVEVRELLQLTAEDLALSSNHQGYGLVRADSAVRAALGKPRVARVSGMAPFDGKLEPAPLELAMLSKVSSTTSGEVSTPGEATSLHPSGTVVDPVAESFPGYRSVKWTGDVDTIDDVNPASTTITMEGDYLITANSEEIPQYELFISSSAGGSVKEPGD